MSMRITELICASLSMHVLGQATGVMWALPATLTDLPSRPGEAGQSPERRRPVVRAAVRGLEAYRVAAQCLATPDPAVPDPAAPGSAAPGSAAQCLAAQRLTARAVESPRAPIAQPAEAADLKSVQSGFESLWGHPEGGAVERPTCNRRHGTAQVVQRSLHCHGCRTPVHDLLVEGLSLCCDAWFTTMALHFRHRGLHPHRIDRRIVCGAPRPPAAGPRWFPRPLVYPSASVCSVFPRRRSLRGGPLTKLMEAAAWRQYRSGAKLLGPETMAPHRCRAVHVLSLLYPQPLPLACVPALSRRHPLRGATAAALQLAGRRTRSGDIPS